MKVADTLEKTAKSKRSKHTINKGEVMQEVLQILEKALQDGKNPLNGWHSNEWRISHYIDAIEIAIETIKENKGE